jgi:hypothetical protein
MHYPSVMFDSPRSVLLRYGRHHGHCKRRKSTFEEGEDYGLQLSNADSCSDPTATAVDPEHE